MLRSMMRINNYSKLFKVIKNEYNVVHKDHLQFLNIRHYNDSPARRYSTLKDIETGFEGQKTKATLLNEEVDALIMVDYVSEVGFKLNNGMSVVGAMAIFPRSVLSWNITKAEEITEDSLSLFIALAPKLDILVIGKGDKDAKVNPEIMQYLRKHKLPFEILPTEKALSTYNFLVDERRYVAGAFIPPSNLTQNMDDIMDKVIADGDAFLVSNRLKDY